MLAVEVDEAVVGLQASSMPSPSALPRTASSLESLAGTAFAPLSVPVKYELDDMGRLGLVMLDEDEAARIDSITSDGEGGFSVVYVINGETVEAHFGPEDHNGSEYYKQTDDAEYWFWHAPIYADCKPVAACVLAAVTAAGVHVEPAETAGQSAPGPGLSDLAIGRLLITAGRFDDALAFLEQARPAGEEEALERRFLLGAVYMRLGMPGKAAEQYEAILAVRPDLTRVRLELARAHYAAGQDDKAKHHFQLSLGDNLPSSVESAVEGFLNAIDARKRWSAHVAVRREDETAWLSAKVLHRTFQLGGFAPYIGYSYERRRSNIALHDYDNHGVIVGLTREF